MNHQEKIQKLNDAFRETLQGGRIVFTAGIANLEAAAREKALFKMQTFCDFEEGDDPYKEHDFGAFVIDNTKYFFKIDYYARNLQHGSENPADPTKTTRVLTLMLASEY